MCFAILLRASVLLRVSKRRARFFKTDWRNAGCFLSVFFSVGIWQCDRMEIIKSIRTWKPLKKSKSSQSNKSSVTVDSSDNYCFSEPVQKDNNVNQRKSQTSLESESLYSPQRPASVQGPLYQNVEPLSKPPPHFLRPKTAQAHYYQGIAQSFLYLDYWLLFKDF